MEQQAVELIGRKQQAADLLYGETDGGGLSELNGAGEGATDLLAELARAIDQDESVTDLRDLFASHAHQSDPTDSAWFVAETEPEEVPDLAGEEGDDDRVLFGIRELGGVLVEAESDEKPALRPAPLPTRPKNRRKKRQLSLLDAPPETDEAPIGVTNWPTAQPAAVDQELAPQQLRLL